MDARTGHTGNTQRAAKRSRDFSKSVKSERNRSSIHEERNRMNPDNTIDNNQKNIICFSDELAARVALRSKDTADPNSDEERGEVVKDVDGGTP